MQRYLTARSVNEARHSLLMSAYWKIPLQVVVLVLGVLVFVFYVFNPPPLLFSAVHTERMRNGPDAAAFAALQTELRRRVSGAARPPPSRSSTARRSGDAAAIDAAGRGAARERSGAAGHAQQRGGARPRIRREGTPSATSPTSTTSSRTSS